MVKPGPSVAGPSANSVASAQQVEGRSTTAAAVVLSRLHADRRVSGRVLSSAWSGWAANITRKPARHVMSSDASSTRSVPEDSAPTAREVKIRAVVQLIT